METLEALEMTDELALAGTGEAVATGLLATVERLASAATALEQAAAKLFERQDALTLVAETELQRQLTAAEAELAELRASAGFRTERVTNSDAATPGRKTLPSAMVNLLAKQGVTVDSVEAGALDTALNSLSIEQRIAVKAQLMRAGLIG